MVHSRSFTTSESSPIPSASSGCSPRYSPFTALPLTLAIQIPSSEYAANVEDYLCAKAAESVEAFFSDIATQYGFAPLGFGEIEDIHGWCHFI